MAVCKAGCIGCTCQKCVSMTQLQWKIILHILIRKNVQIVGHVQKNVRRKLLCKEKYVETGR